MDLKTGNEQLRRVNVRIDSLVEDIRTELLARDDTSKGLSDGKIHSLLRYIANPLKNITIDGDEMMLDDMLDLYNLVISKLNQIIQDRRYSDNKELSDSEIETFKKASDILRTDKENGIDVIDKVYTEIIQEHRSGKLEKTYIGRKKAENEEIKQVSQKIHEIDEHIYTSIEPLETVIKALSPEINLIGIEESEDIKNICMKIEKAEIDISNPDLSNEEKQILILAKNALAERLIEELKNRNSELNDSCKQEDGESIIDYAGRLLVATRVSDIKNQNKLISKLNAMYGEKINIAEFNSATNSYEIKQVSLLDRYFKNLAPGENPTIEDLNEFSKKIQDDLEELRTAMDAKIDEKTELEAQKKELEEQLETEIKTSTLSVVPYIEKDNGENLSEFAKWRQRMAFRFKNFDFMFKDRKEVEKAMCQDKIKRATVSLDRKKLLEDIEHQQRKFKTKYAVAGVKTKAKSNIYAEWDKNRIPNSRKENSSGFDERV